MQRVQLGEKAPTSVGHLGKIGRSPWKEKSGRNLLKEAVCALHFFLNKILLVRNTAVPLKMGF